MLGLLLRLFAANIVGLFLWRATADLWHAPRHRGTLVGLLIGIPYVLLLFGFPAGLAGRLRFPDDDARWSQLILSALIQAVIVSIVYIRGVPRPFNRGARKNPDAKNEKRGPLEFTADDGDLLCDVIDLEFGSTRPEVTRDETAPVIMREDRRPSLRVVHSWGAFASGKFVPSPDAPVLSDAAVFNGRFDVDALVRFSNFASKGVRDDNARGPRGMAIRLTSGGESLDIIGLSIDRFFARTREDFISFSRAMARRGLVKFVWMLFLVTTGRTRAGILCRLIRTKSPASYAELTYHGINAFYYVSRRSGRRRPMRLRLEPIAVTNRGQDVGGVGKARLAEELRAQLDGDGTIVYQLVVVDGSGLPQHRINDAMVRWPRKCPTWTIGTLVLADFEHNVNPEPNYNPHHLCPGIDPSDDEILMARRAAYPASVKRRKAAARGGVLA